MRIRQRLHEGPPDDFRDAAAQSMNPSDRGDGYPIASRTASRNRWVSRK